MHKILYSSQAATDIDRDELQEILLVAQRNNEAANLTGMLLYHPASAQRPATFLQVLEGERGALEDAYVAISADPRHRDIRLLSSKVTAARMFGDWTMSLQYVTDQDLQRMLPGFAADDPDVVRIQDLIKNAAVAEMLLQAYVG